MTDTLIPLDLPPGVYRNGTAYQSRGRWYDAHMVRFFAGSIGPIGGWHEMRNDAGAPLGALTGEPRGIFAWRGAGGNLFIAFGTTSKLYVYSGGVLHDITPAGFTPATNIDTVAASGSVGLYGAGAYGTGPYGVGASTADIVETSSWHLDNFGDYLVAVSTTDKKQYVWEGNVATPAIQVSGTGFPTVVSGCVVTPEGFLVVLGNSNGAANVRGVTWASQRTYTTWTPAVTNSAGDFDLATSGRLMAGKRTRNETLLWTDVDLHVMEYIGGAFVYRFAQAGDKCGAISPRSPVVIDTRAMWMGLNGFFVYDGSVRPVSCDVQDYVFNDFNMAQRTKVFGVTIAEFGEVWWFYPSASSTAVNRCVVYNYIEGHWTIHLIGRTAACDAGPTTLPLMSGYSGTIYEHEAPEHVEVFPSPYLESGPVQLGEGDRLMRVQRIIPDERTQGQVQISFRTANFPNGAIVEYGPYPLANPTSVRFTARQVFVRLTELIPGPWRVGQVRLGVKPGSRR